MSFRTSSRTEVLSVWRFGQHYQHLFPLKAEFEEQKEAELAEQRQTFSSEHEQKEQSYTDKMSQLTAQLLQLDTVVSQVTHTTHTGVIERPQYDWSAERDSLAPISLQ